MDLNVVAAFNCSKEAAKIMKEQGGGVILNTSSMVVFMHSHQVQVILHLNLL